MRLADRPARFGTVDRDTPLLLPPRLREWVPVDPLVPFLIEPVEPLGLRGARLNEGAAAASRIFRRRNLALLAYNLRKERSTHLCDNSPPHSRGSAAFFNPSAGCAGFGYRVSEVRPAAGGPSA